METKNEKQEIPEWFATHPLAAAFKQEQALETLKQRQDSAGRLESILADIRAGFPEQEASLASVLEDLKQAEKHVIDLRAEAMETGRTLQIAKADLDRKRQAVEVSLYSTYDPRIDEAQDFFRTKLDDLRRPGVLDTRPMGASRNLIKMNKVVKMESNFDAVNEAMQYCRGAITRLESLKLIPEFPESEIEGLKEGIPSIDRYQEYTAERSLPKDPPVTAGAPSDYEIKKLLQRRV